MYLLPNRFQQSVTLSKGDKMYKDAIDTAAESSDTELAEELVRCVCVSMYISCFV